MENNTNKYYREAKKTRNENQPIIIVFYELIITPPRRCIHRYTSILIQLSIKNVKYLSSKKKKRQTNFFFFNSIRKKTRFFYRTRWLLACYSFTADIM